MAGLVGENMMQETIQRMGGKNISIGGKVIKPRGYLQKQGEEFGRQANKESVKMKDKNGIEICCENCDDPVVMVYGTGAGVCLIVITMACVHLMTESLPSFIKALVAPNLVIIEQLGGLVK